VHWLRKLNQKQAQFAFDALPPPLACNLLVDINQKDGIVPEASGTKVKCCLADELTGKEILRYYGSTGEFMSISAISHASSALVPPQPTVSRRQQEDIAGRQLEQALQAGDQAGASQAYDKLAAFGPNNSGPFTNPTQAAEFQSLGQSIQAGDLAGAQQEANQIGGQQLASDFNIVQNDVQSGNQAGAQQALANLKGDFWAVYGSQPQAAAAPTTTAPQTATVSVQV
jgi:hypothetical protein